MCGVIGAAMRVPGGCKRDGLTTQRLTLHGVGGERTRVVCSSACAAHATSISCHDLS